ncbi:MAG: cytochrome b [Rhodocyclaceae bacterium]|jgi:cytochrome b561|nr:cytochrome b [Rhodocyclaceae bacterium]
MTTFARAVPGNAYTHTAIALHWLIALGLAGTFGLGVYMSDLPLSPAKLQLYSWHKWAGVSLFVLSLARLAWRLSHRPPALPATMATLERLGARFAHAALYALTLAIPVSGWLMSSAKGVQTVWFGVLPLPDLVVRDAALGERLLGVHQALNLALALIVLLHVGAALKHHLIDRDDVLARMLPFLRQRGRSA